VPFTSQIGLQISMTLVQYSKGSHTPTSAQPLGAHPFVLSHRDVHVSISLCLTREPLTSAQPLGSRSPVLGHRHVQLSRSLSHYVSQENQLDYHIISTLCIEEANTSFHLCLITIHPNHGLPHTGGTQHSIFVSERNHTPSSWASLHRGTQHSIYVSEKNHTSSSWASPPHTWAQRSISVSERNHTPNS
jgi:hypothetical protein